MTKRIYTMKTFASILQFAKEFDTDEKCRLYLENKGGAVHQPVLIAVLSMCIALQLITGY